MKEGKIINLKEGVVNPLKENITPEKLKTFSGCEAMSDAQATEVVFAIQTLANILYDFLSEQSKPNQIKKAA
jgi:hypothetical protein